MAHPDPIQLSEHVYYLAGGVNAALVVVGKEAVLIDTGGDKAYGRDLKRACETLGVSPVAILNTHAHADHYGGNDYLTRAYGVPVYAPPFEASIMASPYLEPVYLFGGAKPPPELLTKWLLAKPSPGARPIEPGVMELLGLSLEIHDTSGHAHRHLAVKIDDVLLAADAVFGVEALERYPLPFGQDVSGQIGSAARVAELGARVVLPGHGTPTEDVSGLVAANLAAFERAAEAVEAACTGVSAAQVLRASCHALGVEMTDMPRYFLNQCTVQAYLSHLRETGRVEARLTDNALLWERRA